MPEEETSAERRERVIASLPPEERPSRDERGRPALPPQSDEEPLPVVTPQPSPTPLPRIGPERSERDVARVVPRATRTPAPRPTPEAQRPAPGVSPGAGPQSVDITVRNLPAGPVVHSRTREQIGLTEYVDGAYAISAYSGWPNQQRISTEASAKMTARVEAQIRGGDSARPIVGLILSIDPDNPQSPGSVFFGKDERRVIIDYKHGQKWQKLLDIWVPSEAAAFDEFALRKENEVITFILNGRELASWNAPTGMPMHAWLWTWESTMSGFRNWSVTKRVEPGPAARPAAPSRTYFGLALESVQDSAYGLRVRDVVPGSPGEAAGIRKGDYLIDVNDRRLDSLSVLDELMSGRDEGRPVQATIVRDGRVYLVRMNP